MNKPITLLFLIILLWFNSKADSTSLTNKYILRKSHSIGISYYGWQSFAFGDGEKPEYAGWGFGKVLAYERFIKDRFSVTIHARQLNSFQKHSKFKIEELSVPIYFSYYPKFFKNQGSFNICVVNGYQKYTFNNDSLNFQNFQTNINLGLHLLLMPKRILKKPNKHWIFEIGFGQPVYNFTGYPMLGSGYFGLKYYLGK